MLRYINKTSWATRHDNRLKMTDVSGLMLGTVWSLKRP